MRIVALIVAVACWLAYPRPGTPVRLSRSFATPEGREFRRLMEGRP